MAGYTGSYIIPVGDMDLAQRADVRGKVDDGLLQQATRLAIRDLLSDLVVRDMLPDVDCGLAAGRDWLIAGPGVAGVDLQYVGFAVPMDHVHGFFGLAINSAVPSLSVVRLTQGATSGQVKGVYQIEQLESRLEPVGYLTEPVYYIRQDFQRFMVLPKLAFGAGGQRLVLFGRTLEPFGATVSAPSV